MLFFPGYEVLDTLHESDNSLLVRCLREGDGRPVILKQLNQSYPSTYALARFQREYDVTQMLRSAHVVEAYDLFRHNNTLVMALEDFGGESLKRCWFSTPRTPGDLLGIADKMVEALAFVHDSHVIHKDLNPANVVWNETSDTLKLIDFGISTQLSSEQAYSCAPRAVEGTLAYLAPEQSGRMNRSVDYRSDFYALGATLYHLATGMLPFAADDPMELIHAHLAQNPMPVRHVLPTFPAALEAVIFKLMAKMAEERYQSFFGLRHDLEACRAEWEGREALLGWTPGQRDLSLQLRIPQKLYGRTAEWEALLAALARVGEGACEWVWIAGPPGIGKSKLVHELHKPMVERRGFFLEGKFDQYKQSDPYEALIGAFRGLFQQLLAESEERLVVWRAKLLDALGDNARLLCDLIPEMALLLGERPPVPRLSSEEGKNRLESTWHHLFRVFGTEEHPLVCFLDDLQWADAATLSLLDGLLSAPVTPYTLWLGAYRDNEVDDAHPLRQLFAMSNPDRVPTHTLSLEALSLGDVQQLLADTLGASSETVQPLAELCMRKTAGNPFFLQQFVKELVRVQLVYPDPTAGRWRWELARIQQASITANVVELMLERIQQLSPDTQRVLQIAACLGGSFALQSLVIALEQPLAPTIRALQEALEADILVPLDGEYKLVASALLVSDEEDAAFAVRYRFLHDRVQQAAYSMLDDEERPVLHRRIGLLLLEHLPESKRRTHLFAIVNHCNHGVDDLASPHERLALAELNAQAGKKAQESAAFALAFSYFQTGLACLPEESWTSHYELTLALHQGAVEAAYQSLQIDEMQRLSDAVLAHARDVLEQFPIYRVRVQFLLGVQGNPTAAITVGLEALKKLGHSFPQRPGTLHVLWDYLRVRRALRGCERDSLLRQPEMTDPHQIATLDLIMMMAPALLSAQPMLLPILMLRGVLLTLEHGRSLYAPYFYGSYAFLLCGVFKRFPEGVAYGRLAMEMVEELQLKEIKARVVMLFNTYIRYWEEPVYKGLDPLLEGYRAGMEVGDHEYASYCLGAYSYLCYAAGRNIATTIPELQQHCKVLQHLQHDQGTMVTELYLQLYLNLAGEAGHPTTLTGPVFEESVVLPRLHKENNGIHIQALHQHRLGLHVLFQEHDEALEQAALAEAYLDSSTSSMNVVLLLFYDALARLGVMRQRPEQRTARWWLRIRKNLRRLKGYARVTPCNYQHKYDLVCAEVACARSQLEKALDAYERAIQGAHANGYAQEEALAHELAGRCLWERGQRLPAMAYLGKAIYLYERWGALAKVHALEQEFAAELHVRTRPFVTSSLSSLTGTAQSTHNTTASWDLMTVMKVLQAISQEIVLPRLLRTVLQNAIENAGAQRGCLLVEADNGWEVAVHDAVRERDDSPSGSSFSPPSDPSTSAQKEASGASPSASDASQRWESSPRVRPPASAPPSTDAAPPSGAPPSTDATPPSGALQNTDAAPPSRVLAEEEGQAAEAGGASQAEEASPEALFSDGMVRYVARTRESLVLTDATQEGNFTRDPYVLAHRPLSVLCAPLLHQGKTMGILYLENNLTADAFTPDRLELLQMLCSQAAISMENALLYNVLEEKVAERTRALEAQYEQLKETQTQLVQSEKMAGLGTLVAGIAHELNNPANFSHQGAQNALGHIKKLHAWLREMIDPEAASELLELFESNFAPIFRNLDAILDGTERMRTIVGGLRTFSRLDEAEQKRVNLVEGLRSTMTLVEPSFREDVAFVTDFLVEPELLCWPSQLNQVFMNLMVNACQAIVERNKREGRENGRLWLRTRSEPGRLLIQFEDEGGGIPPDTQARIFDPFFTTKPVGQGSGLGLSISFGIVQKHHGSIEVESTPGEGTTMTVFLPVTDTSLQTPSSSESWTASPQKEQTL